MAVASIIPRPQGGAALEDNTMLGIDGLNLTSLTTVSSLALGPGGPVMAQLATQTFGSMGQQLLQSMGQQFGLSSSAVDVEIAGFTARSGDGGFARIEDSIHSLGERVGADMADIRTAQENTDDTLHEILNNLSLSDEAKEIKNGGRGGGSWLRAMAEVLGQKLDALADEMNELANRVTKGDPSTTTDFTVASQEFNMLMSATTNALKTVGEAMGKSAGRQ